MHATVSRSAPRPSRPGGRLSRTIIRWISAVLLLAAAGCGPDVEPHRVALLQVNNPRSGSWMNAPVTVDLEEVDLQLSGPVRIYRRTHRGWTEVPSQLDDLDEDGTPEEIFFQVDLAGEERARVEVVEGGWPPGYRARTDAFLAIRDEESGPYRYTDSLIVTAADAPGGDRLLFGGPVWESATIGYYGEVRPGNGTGVVGKRLYRVRLRNVVPDPDTVQSWGSAVMPDVGRLGLGTPMVAADTGVVSLERARTHRIEIPTAGPMRAIVRSTYEGVPAPGGPMRVRSEREIQANGRWTEHRLRVPSEDTTGLRWMTGMMRHPSASYLYGGETEEVAYWFTWGPQTVNDDTLGLAVMVPKRLDPRVVERDTLDHWIQLDPDSTVTTYRYLASWNLESDPLLTRPSFEATIRQVAESWVRATRVRRLPDTTSATGGSAD